MDSKKTHPSSLRTRVRLRASPILLPLSTILLVLLQVQLRSKPLRSSLTPSPTSVFSALRVPHSLFAFSHFVLSFLLFRLLSALRLRPLYNYFNFNRNYYSESRIYYSTIASREMYNEIGRQSFFYFIF
jgi:hypothetical protein